MVRAVCTRRISYQGAFRTALQPGEMLRAIRMPRLSGDARWGYEKACRKPGDFAHAMAAVLLRGDTRRVVIGALGGRPLLLQGDAASMDGAARMRSACDSIRCSVTCSSRCCDALSAEAAA